MTPDQMIAHLILHGFVLTYNIHSGEGMPRIKRQLESKEPQLRWSPSAAEWAVSVSAPPSEYEVIPWGDMQWQHLQLLKESDIQELFTRCNL